MVTLPAWWPRTSCVYCGATLRSAYDREKGRVAAPHPLACKRHVPLVALDPEYADAR